MSDNSCADPGSPSPTSSPEWTSSSATTTATTSTTALGGTGFSSAAAHHEDHKHVGRSLAGVPLHQPPTIGDKILCTWRDEYHPAEVIEIRDRDDHKEFYIHFTEFDKRLDEWVTIDKLALCDDRKRKKSKSLDPSLDDRKITRRQKRKFDEINHIQKGPEEDSRLSMMEKQHEEVTKVKNIHTIEFGVFEIDTWYYSPYPDEYATCERLYICEFCLKYMRKKKTITQHKVKCTYRQPPGIEIYRSNDIVIFEVDGKESKIFCQNLCLLAKLFLDHKTLYYDVEPFLFYVMTQVNASGYHIVAYFSKEKYSPDDYNLACILTLPPYQQNGFGKILISLSYELSKIEGKTGTPERPLSDLGRLSFRSYWKQVLLEVLSKSHNNTSLTIKDLSGVTAMKTEDIISTLQSLNLVKYWKSQHIISVTPEVIQEHLKDVSKNSLSIDPKKLHWTPHKP
ncbi:HAM group protein [Pelomyxa schiedti]|nr:HAM group protein [Pelomyxa schiedti]